MLNTWELISKGESLGFMLVYAGYGKSLAGNLQAFMIDKGLSHLFVIERDSQDNEKATFNAVIRNGRLSTDR